VPWRTVLSTRMGRPGPGLPRRLTCEQGSPSHGLQGRRMEKPGLCQQVYARERTRTSTPKGHRPSTCCVYQFHHAGNLRCHYSPDCVACQLETPRSNCAHIPAQRPPKPACPYTSATHCAFCAHCAHSAECASYQGRRRPEHLQRDRGAAANPAPPSAAPRFGVEQTGDVPARDAATCGPCLRIGQ
jgi:hypothetical protein